MVRHFLACVSKDAEGRETTIEIDVNQERVIIFFLQLLTLINVLFCQASILTLDLLSKNGGGGLFCTLIFQGFPVWLLLFFFCSLL